MDEDPAVARGLVLVVRKGVIPQGLVSQLLVWKTLVLDDRCGAHATTPRAPLASSRAQGVARRDVLPCARESVTLREGRQRVGR